MKKLLAVALVLIFTLCSCSSEKIEGKALEKYLEIIDSLECGTVFVTSDASSNKATIQFRQGENGCEILATTKGNDSEFVNYFDGLYLYSGTDELTRNEAGELDSAKAKEAQETDDFLHRVRIMEEEGSASMLGIILDADSFSDMITRTELIGDVVEGDKKLMRELAATRADIEAKKTTLDESRASQAAAKKELVAKKSSLQSQYTSANNLIKSLRIRKF